MIESVTQGQLITIGNLLWMGMALPTAALFSVMLVRRIRAAGYGLTERLMLGVALVAISMSLHRVFWFTWRLLVDSGLIEQAVELRQLSGWLVLLSLITALGYTLHMSTYLRVWLGRGWLCYVGIYMTILASIGWMM